MRTALSILVLVLLGAASCTETVPATDVRWAGWVLSDVPAEEDRLLLETGAIAITLPDGTSLVEGEASQSSPGFYAMDVEPDTEIGVRITGESIHPTVWRTRTPRASGYWVYGTLFGVDREALALTLEQLSELSGEPLDWTSNPAGTLIYGAPSYADEADPAAWTGAELIALDSTGHEGTVVAIAQDLETGALGLPALASGPVGPNQVQGPIVLFIAHDLEAGPIRLIVEASDGRTVVADWFAEHGDVLSAFHLTLPELEP